MVGQAVAAECRGDVSDVLVCHEQVNGSGVSDLVRYYGCKLFEFGRNKLDELLVAGVDVDSQSTDFFIRSIDSLCQRLSLVEQSGHESVADFASVILLT